MRIKGFVIETTPYIYICRNDAWGSFGGGERGGILCMYVTGNVPV